MTNSTKCFIDLEDPDSLWRHECPSTAAAYIMAAAFTITLIAHLVQGIVYRKGYSWVVIASALWQAAAYYFRVISIKNPNSLFPYAVQFVLLLVAPVWVNAYIYQVFGRMVFNFTDDARLAKIKAWRFGLYFVLLDILAFLIQVFGGASAIAKVENKDDPEEVKRVAERVNRAGDIYTAGIGVQQLFILIFIVLFVKFHLGVRRQAPSLSKSRATTLIYVTYAVLVAITVRIIFRLLEFQVGGSTPGEGSELSKHEVYAYTLDSVPMILVLILLNIFHPGRLMPGRECDFPPRRERKNYHKVGKDGLLPSASNMGSYVPMEGLSRSSSPENGPYGYHNHGGSYGADQSNFANAVPYGGGPPQPAYPAGTPYQHPGNQGRTLGRF